MCIDTQDHDRIKAVQKIQDKLSEVDADPRIDSIIKECNGKLKMSNLNWKDALSAFWESFQGLAKCEDKKAPKLLMYVLLTVILSRSQEEYLFYQEAEPYIMDPQLTTLNWMKAAFENRQIEDIE